MNRYRVLWSLLAGLTKTILVAGAVFFVVLNTFAVIVALSFMMGCEGWDVSTDGGPEQGAIELTRGAA